MTSGYLLNSPTKGRGEDGLFNVDHLVLKEEERGVPLFEFLRRTSLQKIAGRSFRKVLITGKRAKRVWGQKELTSKRGVPIVSAIGKHLCGSLNDKTIMLLKATDARNPGHQDTTRRK